MSADLATWMPLIMAIIGGGGLGTLITSLFTARGTVYKNMNDLVDQLQEDRTTDRATVAALTQRVDMALTELYVEREYSVALYHWGMAGGPPPPPMRKTKS